MWMVFLEIKYVHYKKEYINVEIMGNNNNYVQYVIASSKNNNKLKYYIVSIYSIQSVLINGWELIVNAHCVKTINLELDEEPQREWDRTICTMMGAWIRRYLIFICFIFDICLILLMEWYNKNKVLPRFELGLLDSKSKVLTITP